MAMPGLFARPWSALLLTQDAAGRSRRRAAEPEEAAADQRDRQMPRISDDEAEAWLRRAAGGRSRPLVAGRRVRLDRAGAYGWPDAGWLLAVRAGPRSGWPYGCPGGWPYGLAREVARRS